MGSGAPRRDVRATRRPAPVRCRRLQETIRAGLPRLGQSSPLLPGPPPIWHPPTGVPPAEGPLQLIPPPPPLGLLLRPRHRRPRLRQRTTAGRRHHRWRQRTWTWRRDRAVCRGVRPSHLLRRRCTRRRPSSTCATIAAAWTGRRCAMATSNRRGLEPWSSRHPALPRRAVI